MMASLASEKSALLLFFYLYHLSKPKKLFKLF